MNNPSRNRDNFLGGDHHDEITIDGEPAGTVGEFLDANAELEDACATVHLCPVGDGVLVDLGAGGVVEIRRLGY